MTTIAYRDGIMAADSKTTDERGAFVTRSVKVVRLPSGALLGCSGDADIRDLLKLLSAPRLTAKTLPTRQQIADLKWEGDALLALKSGAIFYVSGYLYETEGESQWIGEVVENHEQFGAVGHGYQFAIGAMAAGKGAAEAVSVACKYDAYTGAPVREFVLRPLSEKAGAE